MISRVYVAQKNKDVREGLYKKSWASLGLKGKISNIQIIDSYLIEHSLGHDSLIKIGEALTNPILEEYSINLIPSGKKSTYLIEIGYKPGVTDNVAHTVKETITDLLHLPHNSNLNVFSSKVFLINGNITNSDAKAIALSLHNPLIESSYITSSQEIEKKRNLPLKVPEVILGKHTPVIKISLNVSDDELVRIGREGVQDPETGGRRGPLALDLDSMKTIREYFIKLQRDPTDIELESLAQTWSEHCKHTIFASAIDDVKEGLYKTYIKGATNIIRMKKGKDDFCVSVFSDNAGGIAFDDEYLITHKVETHNSPSALDPYGGAITGIVGVNRDCIGFGLGAKPVANTYGFCLGQPSDKRKFYKAANFKQEMLSPRRIMDGVIRGINTGGNCSGIPTLSGFIKFDDRFRAKPLVFAGTVGLIPTKINGKPSYEKSAKPGDYIVVVGGRVGLDGIHGATFSSVVMDSNSPATAVQIGDPITQKKLSDAIVKEARAMDLYNSITDNGAGGISCSVAEMAKECGGAKVNLEKVPLKYPGLRPWEIWISESQERMTLAIPPKKWEVFNTLMKRRGVEATVIGEFTDSGKCIVSYGGKNIMDMELDFLHNGYPKKHLQTTPYLYSYPDPKLPKGISRTKVLEDLLSNNNIGSYSFVSEQYDHEVQASSVLKPLSGPGRINTDAQVFKPVLSSNKGVVISAALFPSYSDINTYDMAAGSLDTAVRNAVAAGAKLSHLAILDNFCWCSSYDKKRLAELLDSLKACYDAAVAYGTPFISGKDSMFNDFSGFNEKGKPIKISIPPTLLISAISVMPDLHKTISPEFKSPGDIVYLLGETKDELGASEYFKMLGSLGSNVPKVDYKKNLKTYKALEDAIEHNLIESSLSVTSGGLGIAIAKACVGGMLGTKINLEGDSSIDVKLFSESQGRILVSVSPQNIKKFEKLITGIAFNRLGTVSKDGKVSISSGKNKVVDTNIKKLHGLYHKFSESMK
ncbi:MAG: AIR synthase-related protein [Patescibacteria group bacterium]